MKFVIRAFGEIDKFYMKWSWMSNLRDHMKWPQMPNLWDECQICGTIWNDHKCQICGTNAKSAQIWAASWENQQSAYTKAKTQISCAVTAKLISAFVFATWIVQYLYFLNPKFKASSLLQWLYSLVCVRPGQNPHCWFSHVAAHLLRRVSPH